MKRIITCLLSSLLALLFAGVAAAQEPAQPDPSKYVNTYSRPLREVLADVAEQFGVRINAGGVPEDLMVDFADFRIRPWDIEQTLEALLWPVGYNAEWNYGNGNPYYSVNRYRHSRRNPFEGRALLDYLSAKYDGKDAWEARKAILKADIRHNIGLDKVPEHFDGKIFLSKKRNHGKYAVQDLALEILPGLYAFGAIYWPAKTSRGAHPLVINPHGHSDAGHASDVVQHRCAMQASMGCIAVSFSMFCNGPSPQFDIAYHHTGLAQPYNILCAERLLDYALQFKEVDPTRVGITGCSGGGSQSMFVTAIDDRITLSIPVVMMSSYFAGGCECESGTLLPLSGGGTSNPEIAAMCAPRPMLLVSDGGDWTAMNPEIEVPYVQRIYGFYGAGDRLESVHFPLGQHNYDFDKRQAAYSFLAREWGLNTTGLVGPDGRFDESGNVIESLAEMNIWTAKGISKPADFITDIDGAVAVMNWVKDAR